MTTTLDECSYTSKPLDAHGNVNYNAEENSIWNILITRQMNIIQHRACDEYIEGLRLLDLPKGHVASYQQVSDILKKSTNWSLQPVPALIEDKQFVRLLSNQTFPVTTFIRRREELNYLQEPDVFHEIFGHCPLLTLPAYCEFMHKYGQLSLYTNDEIQARLSRLYWFTIEFGLINTQYGLRAYGSGILSSINETVYCLESPIPKRKSFDPLEVMRTPYDIDVMQPVYFVIDDFDALYRLADMDLLKLAETAIKMGDLPAA